MGCKLKQKNLQVFYIYLVESTEFCILITLLVAACCVPGFKVKFVLLFSCQYFWSLPEDYCILLWHYISLTCCVYLSLEKKYNLSIEEREKETLKSIVLGLQYWGDKEAYISSCIVYSKDSLKHSPPDPLFTHKKCWKLLKTTVSFHSISLLSSPPPLEPLCH